MTEEQEKIIELFNKNVKGKKSDTSSSNQRHDGKSGHWLERQMGLTANGNNAPDLFGYEMKNQTSSGKITFGDWTPDEYIFQHGSPKKAHETNKDYNLTRNDFFKIFGKPNEEKEGRLSWSGIPCPNRYNRINTFGQILTIDSNENIVITYSFSKDTRPDKNNIVPEELQKENLVLAKWNRDSIKKKLEKKFNQKGWFTCKTNSNGEYESIHFGAPMDFDGWVKLFKEGIVFFDSGMYQGNNRNYSQWRASSSHWDSLIIESY